ncbi:MAG: tRNA1(Val) (adenine(37)-N6)-methyltransferase [Alloprevotella sp.]
MFRFKQFVIDDTHCAMKVGTDAVLLGAWADLQGCRRILDVGCGSGVIALMAAQRAPEAQITGVEIDGAATRDAEQNAEASPFADRIRMVHDDITRFAQRGLRFDCILSNPPYHQEDLLPPLAARAAARHTGGGGLCFEALLQAASSLLDGTCPAARFALVLPTAALPHFLPLAAVYGFNVARRTQVITRPGKPCKRTLLELRLLPVPTVCDELVLVGDDGGRSEAYASLCRDFYL